MKYEDYLKSDEWKKLRERALKRAEYRCEFCGSVATMIHHVQYLKEENSEMENINHLVACCKKCHDLCHGKRKDKPLIKNYGNKMMDTINLCLKLRIDNKIMNALLTNYDFLEFKKPKKQRVLEKIKKRPYKEMSEIIENELVR